MGPAAACELRDALLTAAVRALFSFLSHETTTTPPPPPLSPLLQEEPLLVRALLLLLLLLALVLVPLPSCAPAVSRSST